MNKLLNVMFKTVLLCLACSFPLIAQAAVSAWQIVPEKSSLTFIATQNGAPVNGAFKTFSGNIAFSESDLAGSNVEIHVNMGSVTAAYPELVDTLKMPEWFSVKLFPEAIFKANQFKKIDAKTYEADGVLTIRDKTKPVVLTFVVEEQTAKDARVKGHTSLQRNDFGVGQGEWASTDEIKNEVAVDFELSVIKK